MIQGKSLCCLIVLHADTIHAFQPVPPVTDNIIGSNEGLQTCIQSGSFPYQSAQPLDNPGPINDPIERHQTSKFIFLFLVPCSYVIDINLLLVFL